LFGAASEGVLGPAHGITSRVDFGDEFSIWFETMFDAAL
jgi:hypothetical protein